MKATVCPYRYVQRGRTFCHLAIDERRYTTTEVVPLACATCRVPGTLAKHACRHMSFGVEIDEYGGRLTAETCHVACERFVVRLFDFHECGEAVCEHWEPWDEGEAIQKAKTAAEEVRRRSEKPESAAEPEDID